MFLKIALNGARPKSENEFLPQSLAEIEKEVSLLYKNGYKVFHIHCFDSNGIESLKPEDVNNLVLKVKNISSDIRIGISSGEWIEPDLEKRISYIKEWKFVPDFASVNMITLYAMAHWHNTDHKFIFPWLPRNGSLSGNQSFVNKEKIHCSSGIVP